MTTTPPLETATLPEARVRGPLWLDERRLVIAAFALGLATILGAWGSELIGRLVPCELCLEQRLAYYWGLPLLAIVLALWQRLPRAAIGVLLALGTAVFLWSTYMAVYHAGVEWGFWPGPTACTGTGVAVSFEDLTRINEARVVPCDQVQFRLFGISLAGYNALISLAIVALLSTALVARWRRGATA